MNTRRINHSSGSKFEELYGYSRAVRVGDTVWLAGCTGYDYASMTLAGDAAEQTRQTIRNIDAALAKAGAARADIVSLVTHIAHAADWQVIATVLGEEFGDVRPANTAIVAGFPFPDVKVEITATAVIGCG